MGNQNRRSGSEAYRVLRESIATPQATKPPYGPMANWDDNWFMELFADTKAEACQRITEPDLSNGIVVECREAYSFARTRYDVRLGPPLNRAQLDAIRQRYLDKAIFSIIVRKELCVKPVHIDCSGVP